MKNVLFVCYLVFVAISLCGQTKPDVKIILNGQTLSPDQITKIKPGAIYQVQVTGVNLNLYKVTLDKADSSVTSALSFPTFASLPIDGLKTAMAELSAFGGIISVFPKEMQDIITDDTLRSGTLTLKSVLWHRVIEKIKAAPTKPTPKELAMLIMRGSFDQLTLYNAILQTTKNEIDATVLNFYTLYLSGQTVTSVFNNVATPTQLLFQITGHQQTIGELQTRISKGFESYQKQIKTYQAEVADDKDLKALDEKIRNAYTEFNSAIEKVQAPVTAANVIKLWNLVLPVINNNSFNNTYTSIPQQFSKEKSIINIEVKPWHDSLRLSSYKTRLEFPINNDKVFWGISSGFYFGTKANEYYSTKTSIVGAPPTDTTYSIIKEDPGKGEIGFNTMLRWGTRLTKKWDHTFFQFGIGPGVSVSDKIRPRMLLGIGLAFGDKHKFVFDYGYMLGYYDVKSKVYELATEYQANPATVTVSQLKTSCYFSVSYLFYK